MKTLTTYEQLDILKLLNYNQLSSVQQTNYYFNIFIEQNKWELALKEFGEITIGQRIINFNRNKCVLAYKRLSKRILSLFKKDYNYYLTKPELGVVYYQLNDQLLEKWQSAIDKQIPIFLLDDYDCPNGFSVSISFLNKKKNLKFKLPIYPKNIKEMQIIRFWFEQLFRCSLQNAWLFELIINPEMIKLLFENNKNVNFYIQKLYCIYPYNSIYKSQFEFIFDHLIIKKEMTLNFAFINNKDEQINYLLKLLFTCGKRINCICIQRVEEIQELIGLIVNNIKISIDCSKIVPKFEFRDFYSEMEINADRIEINEDDDEKIAFCEYTNIYNPSIKYLAKYYYYLPFFEEDDDEIGRIVFERI
ncbi:F-box domain-containing protein, partial [Meloidogyne graminicola]